MLTCKETSTEPTRKAFEEKLNQLREINENFAEELNWYEWNHICYITKSIWQKYKNEKQKTKCKNLIVLC